MTDNNLTPAELVRTMHLELWGNSDPTAIDRYISPDARTIMTGFEGSTVDVMREDVERYQGAFDDVETEIVELIDAGDKVVLWWRTVGTHTGPYGDIAPEPTGRAHHDGRRRHLQGHRRQGRRSPQLLGRRRGLPPIRLVGRRAVVPCFQAGSGIARPTGATSR